MTARTLNISYTLLLVLALVVVFVKNYLITCDLNWPYDVDFFRDISMVQNALDNHWLNDPSYLGYYSWYTPLKCWVETSLVSLTDLPIPTVITRAGVFLNLLAPVSFIILAYVILRSWPLAVWAGIAFLFFNALSGEPEWVSASYSPWTFPVCFAQPFFYISLAFLITAFRSNKTIYYLAGGAFIGIAILAHAAPAVILIGITGLFVFRQLLRKNESVQIKIRYSLRIFLLTAIPFLIFSSPLLYQLYLKGPGSVHYGPSEFNYPPLSGIGEFLLHNTGVYLFFALAGIWFMKYIKDEISISALHNWLLCAVFLYVYTCAIVLLRKKFPIELPSIVPSFHFLFYLKAAEAILFPIGLFYVSEYLFLKFNIKKITKEAFLFFSSVVVVIVGIVLYLQYPLFENARQTALKVSSSTEDLEIYNFLLHKRADSTVVLCGRNESLFPVMPSGRKMVASDYFFSNPAADYSKRDHDRTMMFHYLNSGSNSDSLSYLLSHYSVDMILVNKQDKIYLPNTLYEKFARLIIENEKYYLYQRR